VAFVDHVHLTEVDRILICPVSPALSASPVEALGGNAMIAREGRDGLAGGLELIEQSLDIQGS
jgi:hypothetical protein